ncbi:hypothetical protein K458DRAFT_73830 [Lentithecium fluviatile CBS 122367]|uniref:Uncharacterized protein n=1 Tax=Lentithecium fluviatile CBS 122367 TaxID=1168545 RepID=A0A6G1IWJ8_9PLEO|nr:hypothetical protein K458DRAFT_73830 [Lentithecium fluviatile CBS 122367]
MSGASTVAARCASLSTAISQIITDTTSFSRRLRDSRHEINALNADLLAVKLSLDIARDDFSHADANIPPLLVEATSTLLDCCSTATQSLHKPIIRLTTSDVRKEIWQIFKKRSLDVLRQNIEALRCALDLVLDLIVLFNDAEDDGDPFASANEWRSPKHSSDTEQPFLNRIDVERNHIEHLTEGRLPVLYTSIERLRACATFILEERNYMRQTDGRSTPHLGSLSPPHARYGDHAPSGRNSPAPPLSPVSTTNGIGAWIANVVHSPTFLQSAVTFADPPARPDVVNREESVPSRGTFYAESVSSATRTHSSGRPITKIAKDESQQRVDSPQQTAKAAGIQHSTYYRASTIISSDNASIFDRGLTSDELAVAMDKRNRLTRTQRAVIDQSLQSITQNTPLDNIERLLWEGANPNVEDDEFGFLYIRAAYELSTDVLKLLVEYGADVSRTIPTSYYSAIHAAVLGKKLDILRYLVGLGMSMDTTNTNGETPLHLAVKTPGTYQLAKFLLDSGADVNREANEEGTPFHLVMNATRLDSRERSMMVELLLAHGAEGEFSVETVERRGKGLSVLGLK